MTSMANVVAGVRTVTSEAKASVNLERPVQTGLSVFKAQLIPSQPGKPTPAKMSPFKGSRKSQFFPVNQSAFPNRSPTTSA
jgi:hypothetical protein